MINRAANSINAKERLIVKMLGDTYNNLLEV